MVRVIVLAGVFLGAWSPASAQTSQGLPGLLRPEAGAAACFERSYDAAHLARNPRQRTTSIRVALRDEVNRAYQPERAVMVRIAIDRHDTPSEVFAIGSCYQENNIDTSNRMLIPSFRMPRGNYCMTWGESADVEGASAFLEPREGGRILVVHFDTGPIRVRQEGARASSDQGSTMAIGRDDRVFMLERVDPARCADLFRAIDF